MNINPVPTRERERAFRQFLSCERAQTTFDRPPQVDTHVGEPDTLVGKTDKGASLDKTDLEHDRAAAKEKLCAASPFVRVTGGTGPARPLAVDPGPAAIDETQCGPLGATGRNRNDKFAVAIQAQRVAPRARMATKDDNRRTLHGRGGARLNAGGR